LTTTKYGARGNALGKRFSRLKAELGYPPELVLHSVRKTVATMLENAGVSEGIAMDLLGHKKKTMSYGRYSGGPSMANKREAVGCLSYPD
jgi:integrase